MNLLSKFPVKRKLQKPTKTRNWIVFLLVSTPTFLLFLMAYRLQPHQEEIVGIFVPKQIQTGIKSTSDPQTKNNPLKKFFQSNFLSTDDLTATARYIKDDKLIRNVIQKLDILSHGNNPNKITDFQKNIHLKSQENSDFVEISIYFRDKEFGIVFVNTLMKEYVNHFEAIEIEERFVFYKNTQLHIQEAENLIKASQFFFSKIDSESSNKKFSLSNLDEEKYSDFHELRELVNNQLLDIDINLSILQQNTPIQTFSQKRLLDIVFNLTESRKKLLKTLKTELEYLLENNKQDATYIITKKRLFEFQSQLLDVRDVFADFRNINNLYRDESIQTPYTVSIISPAQASTNVMRPYLLWYLIAGGIVSSCVGILVCRMVEDFTKKTSLIANIRSLFQIPILGVVPHFSLQDLSLQRTIRESSIDFNQSTKGMECYEKLMQKICDFGIDNTLKVMVFTSIDSGEGKGITVANLAFVCAQAGNKVLVIDADLSSPSQVNYWEKSNAFNLSDCIINKTFISRAIQVIFPGLHIIHAGKIELNHDALLNSPGTTILMTELRTRYDYIFVDTPALSHSRHGCIFANNSDITLLVFNPHHPKHKDRNYHQHLSVMGKGKVGLIVNNLNESALIQRGNFFANAIKKNHRNKQGNLGEIDDFSGSILSDICLPDDQIESNSSRYSDLITLERRRLEKQFADVRRVSFGELSEKLERLWQSWSHCIEFILEQEEEVLQQSLELQRLRYDSTPSNTGHPLSLTLHIKSEQEKLGALAESYMGQCKSLVKMQEELRYTLEIFLIRYAANKRDPSSEVEAISQDIC